MKVLSVVVVFATLLALVVTWPNDNPNYELSLQQLENAVIKANDELLRPSISEEQAEAISICDVPTWFTTSTQLCYKWRADGNSGQCGGALTDTEVCAHVGFPTMFYRDDTDGRGGGCRMQWSIRSPDAEQWFKDNVQICYRWYADGDGGQCGGGAAQLLCASVGSYTAEYRDDTDNRSGGCRMSWMLSIPTDAPEWLRYVQLCYLWFPDGNDGQCGIGEGRELCAYSNFWTPYYRDDTDNRAGGCQMAWELRFYFP